MTPTVDNVIRTVAVSTDEICPTVRGFKFCSNAVQSVCTNKSNAMRSMNTQPRDGHASIGRRHRRCAWWRTAVSVLTVATSVLLARTAHGQTSAPTASAQEDSIFFIQVSNTHVYRKRENVLH